MVTGDPREARLSATLAAPPIRCSLRSTITTGTGASGEIRSTWPHQYVSSITSPITPIFTEGNCLNSCLKSVDDILFLIRRFSVTSYGYKIQGYAQQGNDQSRPGKFGFIKNEQYTKTDAHHYIKRRQHRVSEGPVRSRQIRPLLPQYKYACDGEHIKDHHHK